MTWISNIYEDLVGYIYMYIALKILIQRCTKKASNFNKIYSIARYLATTKFFLATSNLFAANKLRCRCLPKVVKASDSFLSIYTNYPCRKCLDLISIGCQEIRDEC